MGRAYSTRHCVCVCVCVCKLIVVAFTGVGTICYPYFPYEEPVAQSSYAICQSCTGSR